MLSCRFVSVVDIHGLKKNIISVFFGCSCYCFKLTEGQTTMVIQAAHLTWSEGGYVQGFLLKLAIKNTALSLILFLTTFLMRIQIYRSSAKEIHYIYKIVEPYVSNVTKSCNYNTAKQQLVITSHVLFGCLFATEIYMHSIGDAENSISPACFR